MKHKEIEFASLFPTSKIKYASKEEDMFGHWDLEIDGIRIDVKAMKKVSRKDSVPTNLFNFLEIKNVRGDKGWVYGDAHAFAFETLNKWIIVLKEDLQKLISEKVSKEWVKESKDCLYKLYRRYKRQDCVTMVHNMDLVEIAWKIVDKEGNDEQRITRCFNG